MHERLQPVPTGVKLWPWCVKQAFTCCCSHSERQRAYKNVKFIAWDAAVMSYAFRLALHLFPVLTQSPVIVMEATCCTTYCTLCLTQNIGSSCSGVPVCVCACKRTQTRVLGCVHLSVVAEQVRLLQHYRTTPALMQNVY